MKGRILIWAAALLLLTGCGRGLPQSREMDDTALMRTMGVDVGAPPEEKLVTASTARRAKGLQGDGQPPLILSAQRPSISGACLAMQGLSDSYVFYGHVDQLLLGEELARQGGVRETLEHFSRDEQLGLGAQVWLIRGDTAENAIRGGKEKGVNDRLSSLQEDGEMGVAGLTRTAGEVLTDLLENGSAYLPALALNQGEDTALLESGYGVLSGDTLVGWLSGEAARGLELLQQRPGTQLLELDGVSVRMATSTLTCMPVMDGGQLVGLELDVRLLGQVEDRRENLLTRAELEEQVQKMEEKRAELVLGQLQMWNADCLSLKRLTGSARPEWWNAIQQQWEERFPDLEIQVRCTAVVTDTET